ncbi:MAG: ISAzo13 family transposase [Nostoc sp. NMS1]|uniref:ISAzo13 family transposase n=1 Tax=unclassified Nostoc TaxID=2593658 RepID=UPI0025D6A82D|nr:MULTISPECIES: ISAzo13 family transposase [unclassified Nostoc]MBN3908494.1 ISAzo13 family transposase [Nostoc sp. NMS1]MBN3994230.1 ISAzo13 family transposase [Nostoc sp. NMS2]
MSAKEFLKRKFDSLYPHLNERSIRLWAAAEATAFGRGGITQVSQATGLSPKTIRVGIRELEIEPDTQTKNPPFKEKIRSKGGGRKRLLDTDQTLIPDLETLIQPVSCGHSESPLRWTCESTTKIAEKLRNKGHVISARKVASLLYQLGYELQNKRKTKERDSHSDRNIQFQYISDQVENFQARDQLIISLGVNKRKAIKNYNNSAQEWQLKKQFIKYETDHFSEQELLKVLPDEVYNLTTNQEWVNVSINNETVEIAVESIHRWWQDMGKEIYKNATELLITADCSEADKYCLELWKTQLQKLANEFGRIIQFAHFPPATSKWNKIEHRMFYLIAENWRGKPLTIKEVVINLISTTTTNKELILENPPDENNDRIDMNVIDKELSKVHLQKSEFHDDWNYRFLPQNSLDFSNS